MPNPMFHVSGEVVTRIFAHRPSPEILSWFQEPDYGELMSSRLAYLNGPLLCFT